MKPGLILFVFIALLYFLFSRFTIHIPVQDAFIDSILNVLIYGATAAALPWSAKYIDYDPVKTNRFIVIHLIAAIIVSIGCTLVYYGTILLFNRIHLSSMLLPQYFVWRFALGILFYLACETFIYIRLFYAKLARQNADEAQLRLLLTEAELQSLRFQVNPHFLFNSLNSLVALIRTQPDTAARMVIQLSEFFRASLAGDIKHLIPISKEIENVRRYLEIEQIRFSDKLYYSIHNEINDVKILVPNMILQPIVENAVKHGVYESLTPVNIEISTEMNDGFLIIRVKNDVPDENNNKKRAGMGVGLKNTQKRIYLIYGANATMRSEKSDGQFMVTFSLPMLQE
ncbi:MAG: histidine kinase [Ignavibacteria bacterium]|nr:histidine kinase [Ignavibacteria bacterium]